MTVQEVKDTFLEIKQLKSDIVRMKEAVRDVRDSIGDIQMSVSNGMPRSSQTEFEGDSYKKLVNIENILNSQYKKKVQRSHELMILISEWLSNDAIPCEVAITLRMYHIRTFYCKEKKCHRSHSEATLAKQLNLTSVAVRKRLEKGYEYIANF